MDHFTQAVLGAAIGEAGFGPRLGRRAALAGAALGLLPDADGLSWFAGGWSYVVWHRSAGHSLIVLPFLAVALGVLLASLSGARAESRRAPGPPRSGSGPRLRRRRAAWVHLAVWVLLTHPLLDLSTTYGTQLFWPISSERYALDWVAAVDPFFTVPLLVGLAASLILRAHVRLGRSLAAAGLAIAVLYLLFGGLQSARARALASGELSRRGFEPAAVRVSPMLFSVFLWRVAARDDGGNLEVLFVSTWSGRIEHGLSARRPSGGPVEAVLQSPRGRLFLRFADGMVAVRALKGGARPRIELADQRYGLVSRPEITAFSARFELEGGSEIRRADFIARGFQDVPLREELEARLRLLRGE